MNILHICIRLKKNPPPSNNSCVSIQSNCQRLTISVEMNCKANFESKKKTVFPAYMLRICIATCWSNACPPLARIKLSTKMANRWNWRIVWNLWTNYTIVCVLNTFPSTNNIYFVTKCSFTRFQISNEMSFDRVGNGGHWIQSNDLKWKQQNLASIFL